MTLKRLFGKIEKVEELADGTVFIEGIASTEAVDQQGEVVKADAMRAAIPDYLREDGTGPLREMHERWAAGKTVGINVGKDNVTRMTALVVDSEACKKVKEKVYQGFSIGGDVPPGGRSKENPKVIEQINLVEISLVDRPANPEATFKLMKLDEAPASDTAKKTETPAPVPAAAPPVKTEPPKPGAKTVAKGMFQVGWAAELCARIDELARDTQWEADYEQDESEIPNRLKALCAEMCSVLQDLVKEETDELVAAKGTEAVALLAAPGTLKKSERVAVLGRAFLAAAGKKPPELPELVDLRKRVEEAESATKQAGEALGKVTAERNDLHQKHADALLALKAKGVVKDPKFVEAAAKVGALETALTEAQGATEQAGDALRKVLDERDTLKKERDQFEAALEVTSKKAKEQLEGVIEERDALTKARDDLVEKLAVAEVKLKTKGALKVVPVEKAADVGDALTRAKEKPPENTPERALYELKKVQAKGGRPLALGGLLPALQEDAR